MSLDQESAAPRASAPKGRWSEYTQLSRQLKQAGLLDRRRGWYATRIALNLVLLTAGWAAFVVLGDSWWQLLTAAYLAVVFTQLAFVGHDAGHRQLFRSRRTNDLVGLVHANLLVGISFDWWVDKHNAHHTNPNHEDLDPDISITALAFTADQASSKHGLVRLLARYQGWLFFPLLLLEAAHLHLASVKAIVRGRGGPTPSRGCCSWPIPPPMSRRWCWCCRRCRRSRSWSCSRACSGCIWAVRSPPTTRACPP